MKVYYTLLVRDNAKSPWTIEFGDYDRDVVADERDDYLNSYDLRKADTKIIASGDKQVEIEAAVAELNAKT